ncbi:MAG TPA: hypothetical protein VHN80_29105, partial [Kineosporiaceae bacterium]|nr:hypothetical protein [Kineosporiaceae bacterium]
IKRSAVIKRGAVAAAVAAAVAMAFAMTGCTPGSGLLSSKSTSATPSAPAAPGDLRLMPLPDTRAPRNALVPAGQTVIGDDWSLPGWVRPHPNSGFYGERSSPSDDVYVRSVDLSWRQVQPFEGGPIDRLSSGSAQGLTFASLNDQLSRPGPFWIRLFASGQDWAPAWVAKTCHVHGYGPDASGERHLPIWNECVWSALLASYRALFADSQLRADPRLRFVYVPGAFTYAEFDYEMVTAAVRAGDLDRAGYLRWYAHAWTDLAAIFGPYRTKLVFTGEDYPFGPFGAADDLLAQHATAAGIGIRNGITEEFNFHLSQAPAYGSELLENGHLTLDETLPIHDGQHVIGAENECYTSCGFSTDDLYYPLRQSNLKALQLRANWIYVVPGPSYLSRYRPLWDWVRLSLGATASTSADAWASLRDAEDVYWRPGGDADRAHSRAPAGGAWRGRPYVRNLERWLVQVDQPGSMAHRSTVDVRRAVLTPENGTAYEGLATDVAKGDTGLAFTVDPAFVESTRGAVVLKVTYRELDPTSAARGQLVVQYPGRDGVVATSAAAPRSPGAEWRTVTFALPDAVLGSRLPGDATLRVALTGTEGGADDVAVRFVRLVRLDPPAR